MHLKLSVGHEHKKVRLKSMSSSELHSTQRYGTAVRLSVCSAPHPASSVPFRGLTAGHGVVGTSPEKSNLRGKDPGSQLLRGSRSGSISIDYLEEGVLCCSEPYQGAPLIMKLFLSSILDLQPFVWGKLSTKAYALIQGCNH